MVHSYSKPIEVVHDVFLLNAAAPRSAETKINKQFRIAIATQGNNNPSWPENVAHGTNCNLYKRDRQGLDKACFSQSASAVIER